MQFPKCFYKRSFTRSFPSVLFTIYIFLNLMIGIVGGTWVKKGEYPHQVI